MNICEGWFEEIVNKDEFLLKIFWNGKSHHRDGEKEMMIRTKEMVKLVKHMGMISIKEILKETCHILMKISTSQSFVGTSFSMVPRIQRWVMSGSTSHYWNLNSSLLIILKCFYRHFLNIFLKRSMTIH